MNIVEIRNKYPQYKDISDSDLADKLYSRFYSDMPEKDFYSKIGVHKDEGLMEGFVKPTLKAIPRVVGHTVASMAQMPVSGVAAGAKYISSGGNLEAANQVLEDNQKALDDFYLTTEAERQGSQNIGLAMKPFEMAGQGLEEIVKQTPLKGTIAEPIANTIGQASAMFGLGGVKGAAKARLMKDIGGLDTPIEVSAKPYSITPDVERVKAAVKAPEVKAPEIKAKEDIAPVEKVEPTANVDPLIAEARKYDTAEEFVKAKNKQYEETLSKKYPVNELTKSVDPNFKYDKYTEEIGRLRNQASRNPQKTPEQIKLFNELEGKIKELETARATDEAQLTNIWNKAQEGKVPKPAANAEPLIEEARKYKTAEEFVKAQGEPLYHGTDAAIERPTLSHSGRTDEGFLGKGIYLTSTKKMAKVYGKNRIELYVDIKNPLVIEDAMAFGGVNPDKIRNILGLKVNAKPSEVRAALIKQGYDGVVVNEITDNGIRKNAEVVALNDSQIKTKADLTSIWNKAQEGKVEIPKAETPVEGKPAKAALDINKDLIEKGFEGLPERELARYSTIQKVEEVGKAQALVSNPDFFEMAKGNKPIPEDVHPQVLFNVAINEATKAGNIDMLMDLAKSPIAEQRSLAAQQLGASAWNKVKDTIVEKIQEVRKAREELSGKKEVRQKVREKVSKSLKDEVNKVNLSADELSWNKFLDKIVC